MMVGDRRGGALALSDDRAHLAHLVASAVIGTGAIVQVALPAPGWIWPVTSSDSEQATIVHLFCWQYNSSGGGSPDTAGAVDIVPAVLSLQVCSTRYWQWRRLPAPVPAGRAKGGGKGDERPGVDPLIGNGGGGLYRGSERRSSLSLRQAERQGSERHGAIVLISNRSGSLQHGGECCGTPDVWKTWGEDGQRCDAVALISKGARGCQRLCQQGRREV